MSDQMAFWIDTDALHAAASECVACETCLDVCCTAYTNPESGRTPMNRLSIILRLLNGESMDEKDVHTIYTCVDCGRCDTVCPMNIPISSTIADSKVVMVEKGFGPLPKHNDMVENLFKHRNAVNKDNKDRLKWLGDDAEAAIRKKSETLLYLGCMASYLDKETAKASYEILKQAGESFTLLEDEFCCGIYPYNAGKTTEATAVFKEIYAVFKSLGIKLIITPCAGCFRAFSAYYPRVFPEFDIEVKHISQVICDLMEQGKIVFTPATENVVVHDSCKIGRKSGVYDAPRKILRHIGFDVKELPENRENGICCGAGAGVRSIEPKLSMAIGQKILDTAPAEHVVSTCPFCIFNLGYIAKNNNQPHTIKHIASFVLPYLKT